jgi:hypothetical protein
VQQLAQEGPCPEAHEAFDHGVRTVALTRGMAQSKQPGGRALEGSRPLQWQGQWPRVDAGATGRRRDHLDRVRSVRVRGRHGDTQQGWGLTNGVRRKRSGRKRLGMIPAPAAWRDTPRFLLPDALHGASGRVMEPWRYRGASDILHAVSQHVPGLEAAQGRPEEAGKRQLRFRCVAQSLVQRAPATGAETARLAFAKGEPIFGQRGRASTREVLHGLRQFVAQWLGQGRSCAAILEMLMPAEAS